jgi:metallo-beta-lactamase family protein
MKIQFLGAAGTVTGSSYALTSDSGQSILIDLGMFQGVSDIERLNYEPYQFDCARLTGAVLTHAHLDHCGRLPILLPKGFSGNIWMTPATRELTSLSLFDTAKIAKQDNKSQNKPVLFDSNLVTKVIERFKTVEYHERFEIGDFAITMRDAGHILGSASLEIEDHSAKSEMRKIVFSGDLGNSPEDLLRPTELIDGADAVVMESTYGDRLHPSSDPSEIILSEIHAIESSEENATLLIPAFSLERTQELLHIIMHLKQSRRITANLPIFLDGPMGQKATDIYLQYPALFNAHLQEDLRVGDPFDFAGRKIVQGRAESEAISGQLKPKVIIAGSGMMTGGRIVSHTVHYLPMKSTRVLLVGFQGEGTLGRALMDGQRHVVIRGQEIFVQAAITSTQAMSSHADQGQLLTWLKHIKNVKKVFLTHGENGPRAALAKKIREETQSNEVVMPEINQEKEV